MLKCLIIDDEPLAQNVLENYLSRVDTLELVQKCNTAFEAMNVMRKTQIDLLFLDINMPEMSGLEMLKTLRNPPKVILTTAYSEYALVSYEFGVVDYLLKPISFERFFQAVNKVLENLGENEIKTPENNKIEEKSPNNFVFLKSDKKLYKVFYDDIFYLEGYGNYVKVFTAEKMILVLEKLSELEQQLPSEKFVRVHKSYVVSISHIKIIEGNMISIGQAQVPIGESYKAGFEVVLGKFKI
jgi:DNA-binding LytR/AlgR family response regulator